MNSLSPFNSFVTIIIVSSMSASTTVKTRSTVKTWSTQALKALPLQAITTLKAIRMVEGLEIMIVVVHHMIRLILLRGICQFLTPPLYLMISTYSK
jgi:hypothetical protein